MNKPDNGQNKRREPGYPNYDLETCIKFATVIRDLGGSRHPVKKSSIAAQLKVAESTPSFFQRVSSAKTWGIIDGWGTYGLTETGRNYFYPTSEDDKNRAGLALLRCPQGFSGLISRFDGEKLPSTDLLGNVLHQEGGIPDSWKDRAAQIFVKSAQFLGIIDASGFLRYDAAVHTTETPQPSAAKPPTPADSGEDRPPQPDPLAHPAWLYSEPRDDAAPGITNWSYPYKGKVVRVQTPEDLPKELWDKLNAYVQVLKPDQETKP